MAFPPDEPTNEEQQEQLPQDGDTPFRPAPTGDDVDDTHPATDTGVDDQELQDEGVGGAVEGADPDTADDK